MSLLREADLRARARQGTPMYKSASTVLNEKAQTATDVQQFDIFLSHTIADHELILGIWFALEDLGYTAYVDWIHDKSLSRDSVSKKTAAVLRWRLMNCKCLFYATTTNSSSSRWMPWELGFMDGARGRAAILPIVHHDTQQYAGQEYLGIYPYVNRQNSRAGTDRLWIHTAGNCYVTFDDWLTGKEPTEQ